MNSVLTPGQRFLLKGLLALGGFMAANALFLWLFKPRGTELTEAYQWMLLAHIYGGILLLAPMTGFILWHFTVVLRKRHPFAIWTGLGIAAAALLLTATGLFIRTKAATESHRGVYWLHVVLGLAMPAFYILHRVSAEQRPTVKRVVTGLAGLAVACGAMAIPHLLAEKERPYAYPEFRRVGAAAAARAGATGDPFLPFDRSVLVAEANPASMFFPSPAMTRLRGEEPGFRQLHYAAVTNGDVPDEKLLQAEVAKQGFLSSATIGDASCARCHPDTAAQWAQSVHRFASFNNPFYRASVLDMRKEPDGFQKSKWCAACHDPAVLFPGKMAREFDADLPDAQAGLTCLACHAIEDIHSVGGNGGYTLSDYTVNEYLFSGVKSEPGRTLHDLLVKAKPDAHKRHMRKPFLKTSEFCATCHKVSLQDPVNDYRWFRGQNDYDSWHNSGVARNNPETFYLPPKARSCQDCHMPYEDAPLGDVAAKDGKVRSHRFYGVNTALPAVRGDHDMVRRNEEFLRNGTMRVEVSALRRADGAVESGVFLGGAQVREGEEVELQVVVRNLGVGHIFPAGTNDSNEGWLAVEVRSPDGALLLRSGFLREDLHLSPESHTYGATIVDRHGKRIDRRNAKDIYVAAQANVVPPGAADVARYRLVVPAGLAGKDLSVKAVLRWRKFKRDYTEFSFRGREVPVLPVTDIASGEARLRVLPAGAAATPVAVPAKVEGVEWMKWNDLGIALLRQGDTLGATEAFRTVDRLLPAAPDGPRNLARVKIADGKYADALELLQEAEKRAPGDARTAYWIGRVRSRLSEYEPAIAAFRRALEEFPDDRNSWSGLALALFESRRVEESLAAWLEVLRIDPEDANAHWHRHLCYRRLGREADAEEAKKSFERYQVDEEARERTNAYLRENPDVNREAQRVHVHELQPVLE